MMKKRNRAESSRKAVITVLFGIVISAGLDSQNLITNLKAQEKTSRPADMRASVTRHLEAIYSMPYFRTKEDWLYRRDALRLQIQVAAGLLPVPDKCPLNSQIFGRVERSGYSIEKVHFESYSGFMVTGNLYRPLGRSGPFPGVLSPHGHWTYGRLENSEACSVPARCISLARQGYVVFSYDMVGYNDSRQINHRFQGDREALWGFGSLGLHLWNSIRAIDFLESLPEVDRTRLACTGASGGGTQTFLLTAVDDRISLSAPVNMISAHMQGGDVCENAPNLRIDTNNMEIAAMMAPRPMIMVSATGDWTKDTLEVEYPAIQKIYKLLGAEDKLTAVQIKAEHNYNKESREQVYRWFGRWFSADQNSELLTERNLRIEAPSEMLVFYGRPMPSGLRSEREIVEDYIRAAASRVDKLKPKDQPSWESYRATFAPVLKYSLMAEIPSGKDVQAFAVEPVQQDAFRTVRCYIGRQGKADRIPATLWLPGGKAAVRQAILLAHPAGARNFEEGGLPGKLIDVLLRQGCSILIPDLFNTGRSTFQRGEKRSFFTTYNRTDEANRVQDVITSLSYLRGQAGKLPIKVVGFEEAGIWCLFARAFAEDDTSFAIDANQFDAVSDEFFLKHLNIPHIRRAGDIRTAAILNLRSPLWIHNAGPGFPSDWIQSVYQSVAKTNILRIEGQRAEDGSLLDWLLRGLPR